MRWKMTTKGVFSYCTTENVDSVNAVGVVFIDIKTGYGKVRKYELDVPTGNMREITPKKCNGCGKEVIKEE